MAALVEAAEETAAALLEERHAIDNGRAHLDQREEDLQRRESLLDEIRKLAAQLDADAAPASSPGETAPELEADTFRGRNGGKAPDGHTSSPSGSAPSGNGGTTTKAKPPAAPARAPRTPPSGSKRDAVLEAIEHLGEAKGAAVAHHLKLPLSAVRQHLAELVRAGTITATGATASRRYLSHARARELDAANIDREPTATKTPPRAKAVAPASLQPKITDLIARNPGQLTAPLLAQGIPADETDVALIVNRLLDEGAIERTTNGALRIKREDDWS